MYYHDDENHNNEYNGNADADGCGVFKSFITGADFNFFITGGDFNCFITGADSCETSDRHIT